MTEPSLEAVLKWFQAVATHAGGVVDGVQSLDADEALAALGPIEAIIAPSAKQSSVERLAVYARSYWARLLECLQEEFPTLRAALGDEAFDGLAVDYLSARPPTSYTLADLGRAFPTHLAASAPPDDWSQAMVELARLERAVAEVFDLEGGETLGFLSADDLTARPVAERDALRLTTLPTVRLLQFDFDVNAWFTQLRSGDASNPPERRPTFVALSRRQFVVRRLALSAEQYELLSALVAGEALGAAIADFYRRHAAEFAASPPALGPWFAEWAAAGLFGPLKNEALPQAKGPQASGDQA